MREAITSQPSKKNFISAKPWKRKSRKKDGASFSTKKMQFIYRVSKWHQWELQNDWESRRQVNILKRKESHMINPLQALASADIIILLVVVITFEFQKNDWRDHSVHMLFNTDNALLSLVRAGARIIKRRIYQMIPPEASRETPRPGACTMANENRHGVFDINVVQVLPRLRAIVKLMGETNPGFKSEEVLGLHSIQSGGDC